MQEKEVSRLRDGISVGERNQPHLSLPRNDRQHSIDPTTKEESKLTDSLSNSSTFSPV